MNRPNGTKNQLEALMAHTGGPAISVYIPTEVKGAEIDQNPIRLRNQISRAEDSMTELGWKPREIAALLGEARALVEDRSFWEHQRSGLAAFIYPEGETKTAQTTRPVPERLVLADTFHVRPLLPEMEAIRARVLVLTLGKVRLFEVSRSSTERIDVDIPDSFDDVNWFVDRETALQQHSDSRGGQRVHHGHDPSERAPADVDRFLSAIDGSLPDRGEDEVPLVVLGVDNLTSRFATLTGRDTIRPPHSGFGNAEDLPRVVEVVTPVLDELRQKRQAEASERAAAAIGRGRGLTDLRESLEAAVTGRVDELVLKTEAVPRWGRFDPTQLVVQQKNEQGIGDVDLLDRLAVHAVRTGASVDLVEEPVDGHEMVAVLRF